MRNKIKQLIKHVLIRLCINLRNAFSNERLRAKLTDE